MIIYCDIKNKRKFLFETLFHLFHRSKNIINIIYPLIIKKGISRNVTIEMLQMLLSF